MNLSSVGSTSPLLKQLETNGLSANKAKLVQSDLTASEGASSTSTGVTSLSASVRAAFDAKIATDVLSGKLSASDAAAVKKTMDGLDSSATAAAGQATTAAAAPTQVSGSSGSGGGGGGGGGAATKTELSEVVTVSGSTMTTIITYTDGTTVSTTAVASDADKVKYDKSSAGAPAKATDDGYTPAVPKGSLVSQVA